MANLNLDNAQTTDYSNIDAHTVAAMNTNAPGDQEETEFMYSNCAQNYGYFNAIPKLQNAILMKAIWNLGRGYVCDPSLETRLSYITGCGKDTFKQILFNMDVTRMIVGGSFAEIILDEKTGTLLNLIPLYSGNMKIIYNRQGRIKRFEQINKQRKSIKTWKPEEIFYLSYNRIMDEMGGLSVIKVLEKQILADDKLFDVIDKVIKFQSMPFIIFKLKTDVESKITEFAEKLKNIRKTGEDGIIPDDENLLSWEVVQVNPSNIILQWRDAIDTEFYRAIGLPQIIPGRSGQGTESDGKVIYTAFGQLVEDQQKDLQDQIWAQLHIRINLIHPASLLGDLQQDQAKDANQGLDAQMGGGINGV